MSYFAEIDNAAGTSKKVNKRVLLKRLPVVLPYGGLSELDINFVIEYCRIR